MHVKTVCLEFFAYLYIYNLAFPLIIKYTNLEICVNFKNMYKYLMNKCYSAA